MSFRLHLLQLAYHFLPTKINKSLQNDMSRTLENAWDMSIFPQENITPPTISKDGRHQPNPNSWKGTPFLKPPVFLVSSPC